MNANYLTAYFAYGSNIRREGLLHRAHDAIEIDTARLPGHRLTFRGVADIEPAPSRTVIGVLWAVSEADLRALDRYEGYPSLYRRQLVTVLTDTGCARAFTYRLAQPAGRVEQPLRFYYDAIAAGYREWDLPISELRRAVEEAGLGARR